MMSNESQKILNTFSHKLSNCRGSVPTQRLVDLLDEGKYGYSCEEGSPTVITNDFVLADDIAELVAHMTTIFKDPRISLKKEKLVKNAESVSKSDTESLTATYRDTKNWKFQGLEPIPEYVHTFVFEENYAIYENRFVCSLMDVVYDIVSNKINQLSMEFDTLNSKINGSNENFVTANEFVSFTENENGFLSLASSTSPIVKALGLLIKSKKRINALREKIMYIECKKVGNINLDNIDRVNPTNILTYDKNYFFCYNFFRKYLRKDPKFATPKQRYINFVTVNLFKAIENCGFTLEDEESSVSVSRSTVLEFKPISFVNGMFRITVAPTESGLSLESSLISDLNKAEYSIRILDTDSALKLEGFLDPDEYIEKINEEKPITILREILVTDYAHTKGSETYYVEPSNADAVANLEKLVRTCIMVAEGAIYLHSRVCPVCGSRLVSPDAHGYSCANCNSVYHLFTSNANELIWIKLLQRSDIDGEKVELYAREQVEEVKNRPVNVNFRITEKKVMRKCKTVKF